MMVVSGTRASEPVVSLPSLPTRHTHSRSRGSRAAGRESAAGRSWGQPRRRARVPRVGGAHTLRPALVAEHELFLRSALLAGRLRPARQRASGPAAGPAKAPVTATHQLGVEVGPVLLGRALGQRAVVRAGAGADARAGALLRQLAAEGEGHGVGVGGVGAREEPERARRSETRRRQGKSKVWSTMLRSGCWWATAHCRPSPGRWRPHAAPGLQRDQASPGYRAGGWVSGECGSQWQACEAAARVQARPPTSPHGARALILGLACCLIARNATATDPRAPQGLKGHAPWGVLA